MDEGTGLRELSMPPLRGDRLVGGLADTVFENAEAVPDAVQFMRKQDGVWRDVSMARFRDEVLALAKGLLARGIRFGDRVAIMARTRYEWTLFDYALWTIGAEVVPLYPTASAGQVRYILGQTDAVACVVEDDDHAMTLGAVVDHLPRLTRVWQIDTGIVNELIDAGERVSDSVVHRHRLAVTPDSVATIAYTSGTTGMPKGCMLTHRNMASQVDVMTGQALALLTDERGNVTATTLLFLPLAHVYGRTIQVAAVRRRVPLAHEPEMKAEAILPDLAAVRPNFLVAVPHIFEKVFDAARRKAEAAGRGELFDQAVDVAVTYAEAIERRVFGEGPGPGPVLRMKHRLYDKLVYSKVRQVFGGRLRNCISGGSALDRRLGLFFAGVGITIHEGYGLTESCAGAICNPPGRVRFGTVGRPMPGVAVRIAEDGEVLLRAEQNFIAYLDDEEDSRRVFNDGWLATGDLGRFDEHGYLVITGRKKDVIVTSGGKTVSPMPLEERVRAHPLVAQCVVVGDDRPFIAALITLDADGLAHWLQLRGRPVRPPEEVVGDKELEAEIRRAVTAANSQVSKAESIRAFRILPKQFTPEDGLLTPSLKLRREEIARVYAKAIEEIYTG